MRTTYRIYKLEPGEGRKFLGIVAVRLGAADSDAEALAMARGLYGQGQYEIEVQGID